MRNIYAASVSIDNNRRDFENLHGITYNTKTEFVEEVQKLFGSNTWVDMHDLSDFSDALNNDELDTDGTWTIFVTIENYYGY